MTDDFDIYWSRHNAIAEQLIAAMITDGFADDEETKKTANDFVNRAYVDDITDEEWLAEAKQRLSL